MNTPIIVAHRGLHDEHPENSLKAMLAAWDAGIAWCECDVRGSKEHEPFLIHDETLERTTNGAGRISDVPSEYLHRVTLRRADGTIADGCVPRLTSVVSAIPEGCKLLVEIKPDVSREVVRRTMELCDPEKCVVQSFDIRVLNEAIYAQRGIRLMELVEDATTGRKLLGGLNCRHDTLFAGIVEDLHERGVPVGAWTVNEDADIRRMLQLGIDTIISDRPLRVRDICREIA